MKTSICVLLSGLFVVGTGGAQPVKPDNAAPLALRLYAQIAHKTLTPIDVVNTQAGRLLLKAIDVPGCAAVVGGNFGNAAARFRQTQHFASPNWVVAAEETETGSHVLYALTYVNGDYHRVLLFPSFFSPRSLMRRLRTGGADRINPMPDLELVLGLKPGSLTDELFQAIALGHEQTHANQSAIEDVRCPGLSCLNTMRIVKNCFPQLIDPAPTQLTLVAPGFLVKPPESCGECHPDRKGQPVITPRPRVKAVVSATGRGTTGRAKGY